MDTKEQKNTIEDIISQIKNVWFVILFIGGAIVSWTTFSNRLDNHEARLNVLEEKVENLDPRITQIQVDISAIKTTLEILTAER